MRRYTDAQATEKKILRNAFADGDAWFNTGDLLREVDVGFTLGLSPTTSLWTEWETPSAGSPKTLPTNEVGEILNGFPDIQFCNVYGVRLPNADGRAGMVALVLQPGVGALDLAAFSRFVQRELPAYARPVFLRVQADMGVTGTFKMLKGQLQQDGYDLGRIAEPVYVLKPDAQAYEALDAEFAQKIDAGEAGY